MAQTRYSAGEGTALLWAFPVDVDEISFSQRSAGPVRDSASGVVVGNHVGLGDQGHFPPVRIAPRTWTSTPP